MIYSYKIIYDIEKDMWNWRHGSKGSFMGINNLDSIDNDTDSKVAQRIAVLTKQPAETILKPYLQAKKADPDGKLNKFIRTAEKEFQDKFTDACLILEKITGRLLVSNEFTFYVTTFPRMTVFFDSYVIYMYDSTEGVWGMPIDGFLHEALHFQFNHYWRQNQLSPVSKLNDDDFDKLKEALTVILDDELRPIITLPDESYSNLAYLRDPLHEYWKKYHDFDKLVDFGLDELAKSSKNIR
ncbi:MAG TPA: hypothetical protein VMR16_00880 [Candidatus Saccharimonadales bacterium]|nr:hypothetical protein [Candidatus Saccharimonadales bacterium]